MRRALEWLSPATLAGRTTLALLAGLLVFHFGSVWLLERGVRGALEDGREAHLADHVAMAARVLGAPPEEVRGAAARALSTPPSTPPGGAPAQPKPRTRHPWYRSVPGWSGTRQS